MHEIKKSRGASWSRRRPGDFSQLLGNDCSAQQARFVLTGEQKETRRVREDSMIFIDRVLHRVVAGCSWSWGMQTTPPLPIK